MSLRSANRYFAELTKVRSSMIDPQFGMNDDRVWAFATAAVVPIVLAMKVSRPDDYDSVVRGFDAEALYGAFLLCDDAMTFLDRTLDLGGAGGGSDVQSDEARYAVRMTFLEALVYKIWCRDPENAKLLDANQTLGFSWGANSLPKLANNV